MRLQQSAGDQNYAKKEVVKDDRQMGVLIVGQVTTKDTKEALKKHIEEKMSNSLKDGESVESIIQKNKRNR